MANEQQQVGTGRLAGAKSPSYQRAVNEPETRASRYTARYMLASDIAYVLSAAELGVTPPKPAGGLLKALLPLYEEVGSIDTSRPLGDVVAQRVKKMIATVVVRAEEGVGFGNQALEMGYEVGAGL